jgi:hypothetical protein
MTSKLNQIAIRIRSELHELEDVFLQIALCGQPWADLINQGWFKFNSLKVEKVPIFIDDYAEGRDSGIIDLLLVENIDRYHLNDLSRKTERYINRKIRSLVLSRDEYEHLLPSLEARPLLLIWEAKVE